MIALKAIVRLVAFLLLVALAVVGAALALFSIQGGSSGLAIPQLAEIVGLPQLRDTLDGFLGRLEGSGPVDGITLLASLGAIAVGLLLLAGVFVPRRERLVALDETERGRLAARRRPLSQLARAYAVRVDGVTSAKVKVKPRRSSGGRVSVNAERTRTAAPEAVEDAISSALGPLTGPFRLKASVDSRVGDSGSRVQ